jgi:hypothetical protein
MLGVHDTQAHQRVLVHSHQAPARHILDRKLNLYKSVKHDFVYTVLFLIVPYVPSYSYHL